MIARTISVREVDAATTQGWRDLADAALVPNGWLDPRFVLPAREWDAMAQDLQLCIVWDGDRVCGVLPVTGHRLFRRLAPESTSTGGQFVDWHADSVTPLIDAEAPDDAMEALICAAIDHWPRVRLVLRGMPATGPIADALKTTVLRRRLAVTRSDQWRRPIATPGAAIDIAHPGCSTPLLVGHMSGRRRREVLRRARALEHDLGGELVLNRIDGRVARDAFETFQATGWKGDLAQNGRAVSLDAEYRHWFRQVVDGFAADGDLIAHELRVGDAVVYMHLAVRSGGWGFGLLDAYRGGLEAHRAGTLGRLAVTAELSAASGLAGFEPGVPEGDTEALRLMPDSYPVHDVTVHAPGYRGAVSQLVPVVEGLRARLGRTA